MRDERKTKSQLIRELRTLHAKLKRVEKSEDKRRRLVDELREGERKYRLLMEHAGAGVGYYDTNGRLLLINGPGAAVLRKRPDEVVGKSMLELFGEDRGSVYLKRMRDVVATGERQQFEDFVELPSGDKWFVSTFALITADDDTIEGVQIISQDITERRRVENALRESEERYCRLADNFPNGTVTVYDKDLRLTFVAGSEMEQYGAKPEDFVGKHFTELALPETFAIAEPHLRGAFEGLTSTYETPYWGDRFYYVSVAPLHDADGMINEILVVSQNMTERKRAEEKLRESEEKFRAIANYTADWENWVGPDGKLLWVNPAVERITGYSVEEFFARHASSQFICAEEDKGVFTAQFERAIRGSSENDQEFRFVRKDGTKRWGSVSWRPIFASDGTPLGHRSSIRDITERKRAEEALRESEEKYRNLVESISDVVYAIDGSGVLTYISPVVKNTLGYEPDELIGRHFLEIVHKEDHDLLMRRFSEIREGIVKHSDYRLIGKQGDIKWVRTLTNPIMGEEGFVGARGVLIDITERKQAEEALRESEERFRHLSDAAFEGITIHEGGVLLRANKRFFEMFGFKPDELLGKQAIPLTIAPEAKEFMRKQIATGGLGPYESIGLRKDGTRFPMEIRAREMEYEGRKVRGVALMDITERKQAEMALAESERKLRTLFEILPVGVSILNAERKIVYVNPALERILDISTESLFKGDYRIRTHLRSDGTLMPAEEFAGVRAIKEQRAVHNVETGVVKEDGTVIWTNVSAVPLGFPDWEVLVVTSDITERKGAEEALHRREELFQALTEDSSDVITIIDAHGTVQYQSPNYKIVWGRDPSGEIGRDLYKDVHPDDVALVSDRFNYLLRNPEGTVHIEARARHEDGSWLTLDIVGHNLVDNPAVRGIVVHFHDITERKRAVEALRASEERYRRLFEGDLAGDYVSTPAGKLIACNAAFARIFRFKSIDDALATNTHELYPNPEARQLFLRSLRQNRRLELREAWLKRRDGTDLHVIENTFGVFDVKSELIEIQGYLLDDTERKLAEKALRESEERFRELFNRMSSGVAVYEAIDSGGDFIFRDFNPAAERIEKVNRKDILGKRVTEAFPGVKSFGVFEVFQRVWQTGKPEYLPENIYKDEMDTGSWRENSVFKLPTGEIVTIYNDITERKQAAEALQKSEERYRSLFANMLDGFAYCKMIFDDQNQPVDFVYLAVNSAFEKVTGLTNVEGKRVSEVLPDVKESSPELLERYGRVALTGNPEQFEYDFKPLNQRLSISVYSTEKGYFVAVFENITERRRAEERRITSQEQLRHLAGHLQSVREEERKHLSQEFHDQLGQTLTALKMDFAMLQRELADKTRDVSRSTLGEKIQLMEGLIDTGIQGIREIMSELHPVLLDQLGLVAALEWEVERFQKRSGLQCRFTSELGEIPFDPKKSIALFRIFQEAVTNVARHAHATTVEISVRREDDEVILEIRDNGIGIEPNAEHKARSFGLVGMRERAVLLGGTLEITGIKGRATTILVRMPYEQTLPDGGVAL